MDVAEAEAVVEPSVAGISVPTNDQLLVEVVVAAAAAVAMVEEVAVAHLVLLVRMCLHLLNSNEATMEATLPMMHGELVKSIGCVEW